MKLLPAIIPSGFISLVLACSPLPLVKDRSIGVDVYIRPVSIDGYQVDPDQAADVRMILDRRIPDLVSRRMEDIGIPWRSATFSEDQLKFVDQYIKSMTNEMPLTPEERSEFEKKAVGLWPTPSIVILPIIEKTDVDFEKNAQMLLCVLSAAGGHPSAGSTQPPNEIAMQLGLIVRHDYEKPAINLLWKGRSKPKLLDVLSEQGYLRFLESELRTVIPRTQTNAQIPRKQSDTELP